MPPRLLICSKATLLELKHEVSLMLMKKQEFLDLFNNHLNICILPDQEKRAYVTWKSFMERTSIKQ
jgi:hypothetical protein